MPENLNHWYDGLFYDLFIAPHQDRVFAQVREGLPEDSTVLDVGCGTGRLASQLLDKCGKIVIIDQSERNINVARRKLAGISPEKLTIKHMNALEFLVKNDFRFDFVIMSYVLHEVDEEDRDVLLYASSAAGGRIILIDYLVPQPRNYCGALNQLVEYAAGTFHYRNFKSFVRNGGLNGLLEKVPLNVLGEVRNQPCSSHIVVVEGKNGHNREARLPYPVRNTTLNKVRRRRILWRRTVKEKVFL